MEKRKTDLVIGLTISRGSELRGVRDLLRAREAYFREKPPVIIFNNSFSKRVTNRLREFDAAYPAVHLLDNHDRRPFRDGLLAWMISKCMQFALDHYDFKAFLKIDPDSLIIGPDLDIDICTYFQNNPEAGQLGSFKYNCNNLERNFQIIEQRFYTDPLDFSCIINELKKRNPDYIPGMHAQGGGTAYSYACVREIIERPPLGFDRLRESFMLEDVLFSTYALYLGFQIHSFVDRQHPFAIAWKGLPMPIKKLRSLNKKLVHSIKNSPADSVRRRIFAAYRTSDTKKNGE